MAARWATLGALGQGGESALWPFQPSAPRASAEVLPANGPARSQTCCSAPVLSAHASRPMPSTVRNTGCCSVLPARSAKFRRYLSKLDCSTASTSAAAPLSTLCDSGKEGSARLGSARRLGGEWAVAAAQRVGQRLAASWSHMLEFPLEVDLVRGQPLGAARPGQLLRGQRRSAA